MAGAGRFSRQAVDYAAAEPKNVDVETEDGQTSRYAVVNVGPDDRCGLLERLGFEPRPLE